MLEASLGNYTLTVAVLKAEFKISLFIDTVLIDVAAQPSSARFY